MFLQGKFLWVGFFFFQGGGRCKLQFPSTQVFWAKQLYVYMVYQEEKREKLLVPCGLKRLVCSGQLNTQQMILIIATESAVFVPLSCSLAVNISDPWHLWQPFIVYQGLLQISFDPSLQQPAEPCDQKQPPQSQTRGLLILPLLSPQLGAITFLSHQ